MTRTHLLADALALVSLASLTGAGAVLVLGPAEVTPALGAYAAGLAGFGGVGWLLARRVPDNRIGWCFSVGGLCWALLGLSEALAATAVAQGRAAEALPRVLLMLPEATWILPMAFSVQLPLLLLPNGRLLSRRWRWAVWATAAAIVSVPGFLTHPAPIDGTDPELMNPLGVRALGIAPLVVALTGAVLMGLVLVAGGISLVLRYRRSRGVERQQLRWVAFGGCLAVASQNVGSVPGVPDVVGNAATGLMFAVPVCIGIAVLRYRLYDLGRLVSRTVSYAVLTTLLLGFYLVLVTAVTRLAPASSSLAVAASTLAAAALFQPLRRRVQAWVDRRFNRARYDADQTVEEFRRRLRDEVDLQAVRADLLHVVDGTVQPATVGLWLRDPG